MLRHICALLLLGCPLAWAQPYVNYRGIVNAASYMPPGLPGGEIARGSIFSIFGRNIGPDTLAQVSAFPLPITFSGVSIKITQGATTVNALPIVVTAGQVNAIMPSNAPLGKVSVQLSYQGQAGNPTTATVVDNSFGTFAVNSGGFGPGILQNYIAADNQPINSLRQTASPGQAITLWGTGLGPVGGPDNVAPSAGNLPTQVEVFVGGKIAPLLYHGRTPCCSGVDQIVFQVPDDAPLGCYVPVQVRTGGTALSNAVTMSIQNSRGACSDAANPFSTIYTQNGKSGAVFLARVARRIDVDVPATSDDTQDFAYGTFRAISGDGFFDPLFSLPPAGTCTMYTAVRQSTVLGIPLQFGTTGTGLDAGAALSAGGAAVPHVSNAYYAGVIGNDNAGTASSTLALKTAAPTQVQSPGGADIGVFQATPNAPTQVNWTNRDTFTVVDRSQGLSPNWSVSGAPSGLMLITGSNYDLPMSAGRGFVCTASAAAGTFAVPSYVLQSLPRSRSDTGQSTAYILIVPLPATAASFTAPGMDRGIAIEVFGSEKTVLFQ